MRSERRTSIILAVTFIVLLSMFWLLPSVAFVVFISLLLSLLLRRLVDHLQKRMPRGLAAAVTLPVFVLVVIGFLTLVSSTLIPSLQKFIKDLPEITASVQQLPILSESNFLSQEIDELWNEMANLSILALKSSLTMLISIFSKVLDIVIILFVTFYLLKEGETIERWFAHLFPSKDYTRVLTLFAKILKSLCIYITSQLAICFIMGPLVFLYFTLRGLPYASVFAVASGISEFLPVIGPTLASAFGTVLTATVSPWIAMQTLCFYLILTQLNHNVIYPLLIGKTLNLHPIAIILGILLGGELLGAAGMFLAVPCMVIIRLVIIDIHAAEVHIRKTPPDTTESGK